MVIVLQGAMDEEINVLLEYFKPIEERIIGGFNFYISNYFGNKIIISKTDVGMLNASISTTIAISEFKPDLIVNQGCAGAHTTELEVGNLIIAEKAAYINNFKTNTKLKGEGSDSIEWLPITKRSYLIDSTMKYFDMAKFVPYTGIKIFGIVGTGDMFSKEYDRILYLHSLFGELSEDMETVAAFKACENFNVDRIAFRIISNNELTNTEFDRSTCQTVQNFTIKFVDTLINNA